MLEWKRVTFNLDKLNSHFAKGYAANVVSRQKYLMLNESFVATVWVSTSQWLERSPRSRRVAQWLERLLRSR